MRSLSFFLSKKVLMDFLVSQSDLLPTYFDLDLEPGSDAWVWTRPGSLSPKRQRRFAGGEGLLSSFLRIFLRFSLFQEDLFRDPLDCARLQWGCLRMLRVFWVFLRCIVLDFGWPRRQAKMSGSFLGGGSLKGASDSSSPMQRRSMMAWVSVGFYLGIGRDYLPEIMVQYYSLLGYSMDIFPALPGKPKRPVLRTLTQGNFSRPAFIITIVGVIMSNGLKKQGLKTNRNFIVDFRNGKYQGELSERSRVPDGTGMLLNIDYQLVIASWNQGSIEGEAVFFYPNGNVFFGSVFRDEAFGTSVFCFSRERQVIYTFPGSEEESAVVIECEVRRTLTSAKMHKSQLKKVVASQKRGEANLFYDSNDRLKNKPIKIMEVRSYQRQEDKWQIIRQMSGGVLTEEFQGYKKYIKHHFNAKIKNKSQRIDVIQTSKYAQIRYKKAGLVIRLQQKADTARRVKLVGYFDNHEEQCDIFLRNKSGFEPGFEQFCEGQSFSYRKERSTMCKTSMANYFRKSTNFINNFIDIKPTLKILTFFRTIFEEVDDEASMKHAQSQLQMAPGDESVHEVNQKHKNSHQSSFQNIVLQNAKSDIYSKVDRRKSPITQGKPSPLKSIRNSIIEINKNKQTHQQSVYDDNYEPKSDLYKQFIDESRVQRPREYLRYTESSPSLKKLDENSRETKRKFHNEKYNYLASNDRKNAQGDEKGLGRSQSHLHLDLNRLKRQNHYSFDKENREMAYQQGQNDNFHDESIGVLTHDYQRIRRQLVDKKYSESKRRYRGTDASPQGTPTLKSPSRYSYLKSSVFSPSGTPGRGKRQWR